MRILFVHQNFPAQFKHLAPALAARGDEVVAIGMRNHGGETTPPPTGLLLSGVRYYRSAGKYNTAKDGHPWSRDFDSKVIRGEATMQVAMKLADAGFTPDAIVAHPAWGEAIFLPEVWPDVPLGLYCEMMYRTTDCEYDFDPEFPFPLEPRLDRARLAVRSLSQSMLWPVATAGISATAFQASTYPEPMARKITVIHDGIDTDVVKPAHPQPITVDNGQTFNADSEIVTFVNRNLEPLRGYHRFMRALPELQRRRLNAHVFIVGGDGQSYGPAPASGTWKQQFLDEVKERIDMSRVHFVGNIPYETYLNLMRLSKLHVYLTYPFVASWSLAEAMALGVPIVANDVDPVLEFLTEGETGLLIDFFDGNALVDRACTLLEDRELARKLGSNARELIVRNYDLKTKCLPQQLAWVDALATGSHVRR